MCRCSRFQLQANDERICSFVTISFPSFIAPPAVIVTQKHIHTHKVGDAEIIFLLFEPADDEATNFTPTSEYTRAPFYDKILVLLKN